MPKKRRPKTFNPTVETEEKQLDEHLEPAKPPLSLKELRKRREEEADAAKEKDSGKGPGNPE